MYIFQKKEKWPLFIGFLLVIFCVIHSKTIVKMNHTCSQPTAEAMPAYLEQLDHLACLTYASWEEFRAIARPMLPRIISDWELKFIYHYLQRPRESKDRPMTREDQLKMLLIFTSTDNLRNKVGVRR